MKEVLPKLTRWKSSGAR